MELENCDTLAFFIFYIFRYIIVYMYKYMHNSKFVRSDTFKMSQQELQCHNNYSNIV